MRSNKSLVIALACGLLCALCVGLYVGGLEQQSEQVRQEALARYGGDQLEVWVAARDLGPGDVIGANDVEVRLWVADLLPTGAQTNQTVVVGQEVSAAIYEDEVITASRLGQQTLALDVPQGLSAISVPAGEVETVGGALMSGMRPDVYATGASATTLLVERALVLEVSKAEGTLGGSSNRWVTLAVPESSVEELVRAAQNLSLYFVLPPQETS